MDDRDALPVWILRAALVVQFVAAGWLVATSAGSGLALVYGDWAPGLAPSLAIVEGGLLILLGLILAARKAAAVLLIGSLWFTVDSLCGVLAGGASPQLLASRAVRFIAPLVLLYLSRPGASTERYEVPIADRVVNWLRVGVALVFASHGASALAGNASFVELITASGRNLLSATIQTADARAALVVIGTLDIAAALLLLTTRWRTVAGYMALWGGIAAASRMTAYGWVGVPETLLRTCNAAAPLALLLWSAKPAHVRAPAGHFCRVGMILIGLLPWAPAMAGTSGGAAPQVVNLLPASGATGISARANLCVEATDPGGENLTLTFHGRDLSAEPAEDFTLIALPDTQAYAQSYPAIFMAQTRWVVEQRKALNIPFVTQLGDVVDAGMSEFEWKIADEAFSLLEDPATTGLPGGIPYGIAVGSHDQAHRSHGTRNNPGWTTPLYNQYFGLDRFEHLDYFGGNFGDNNDNSYQLFSASGMDFIILHLEYERVGITDMALREQVLDWADEILETYSDRRAIVSSHFLLNWFDASFTDQGQVIYDRLKHHPNLFLMLCAHLAGEPRRTDTFQGSTVHTLMSDYQFYNNGGEGYLRMYTFSPAANEIRSDTYSPWLDEFRVNPKDEFTVGYDMDEGVPFEPIGTLEDVPSGDVACLEWTGRLGNEFEWYVSASNSTAAGSGAVWSFTGDGSCQTADDCDDGDSCTLATCIGGTCRIIPRHACCEVDLDCDDQNPCTDDVCSAMICQNTPNTSPCSDGSACTGGDVCAEGVCSGTSDNCDDGNACTLDTCFEDACLHEYAPAEGCCASDFDCHDADPCTGDICLPSGDCTNVLDSECCTEVAQCDTGSSCSMATCSTTNKAAYRVNGNEHVTMRPKGYWPVDATSAASVFTLEVWFKWDGSGFVTYTSEPEKGGLSAYPLVTRGRADSRNHTESAERNMNYFLGILQDPPVLVADFEEHATGSNPGDNHPVTGNTAISAGVWHHAAASYDGNCWQLYLDGQPETDGANCPGQPPDHESIAGLNFGSAQDFQGWIEGHFSGLLDEIRLWNRALSPAEIQANMNVQIETHPDLIGRWGLDEVVDLYVFDSTGNGHTGVAVGGTWETVDVLPLGGNECSYTFMSPQPIGSLTVRPRPDSTELSWTSQGFNTTYDVISGTIADLRSGGSNPQAECLAEDVFDVQFEDTRPIPPDAGLFYLVRGVNDCGAGTYGTTSHGQPRAPQNGCP